MVLAGAFRSSCNVTTREDFSFVLPQSQLAIPLHYAIPFRELRTLEGKCNIHLSSLSSSYAFQSTSLIGQQSTCSKRQELPEDSHCRSRTVRYREEPLDDVVDYHLARSSTCGPLYFATQSGFQIMIRTCYNLNTMLLTCCGAYSQFHKCNKYFFCLAVQLA